MAKIAELTNPEGWAAWVASRPPIVRDLCAALPPDRLYLLKTSGHRGTVVSYSEDGTVTVAVTGEYNALMFDRQVFGIKPEDLEECDLPCDDDPLGTILTEREDVDTFIDAVHPGVRAARGL